MFANLIYRSSFKKKALIPSGSHMVSGSEQGRLLTQFAAMSREGRILELGTFSGKSNLHPPMCEGYPMYNAGTDRMYCILPQDMPRLVFLKEPRKPAKPLPAQHQVREQQGLLS